MSMSLRALLVITIVLWLSIHSSAWAWNGCNIDNKYLEYGNGDTRYAYACDEGDTGWPCFYTEIEGCPEGCIYRICFAATVTACEWQELEYTNDDHPFMPCGASQVLTKDCWNLSDDGQAFVCAHEDAACWRCLNRFAAEDDWTDWWLDQGYMHEEHKEKCDC